mmetsp:Transcript_32365/g.72534  ORF Transcript_32365/g.72534 Transcript_32365/m.72534 type:complete len:566 (-) Transcript_32365:130-1827(-)
MHPKHLLCKLLPDSVDILCTHPMFGPQSGARSWIGLPFMFEKVRVRQQVAGALAASVLQFFERQGCQMIAMSCEEHDEYAARSQFITHFTGRVLGNLKLSSTPVDTQGFKAVLRLIDQTNNDSFDLFYGLYKHNTFSQAQIADVTSAVARVSHDLIHFNERSAGLSALLGRVGTSKTASQSARAAELKAQGKDIIATLGVGEPDYPPPQCVQQAVLEAFDRGDHTYTPVPGIPALRQAICKSLSDRKDMHYEPDEVVCCSGGKQAIYAAVLATVEPGDEVFIPTPAWVSYEEMTKLAGGTPVTALRPAGYQLSEKYLRAHLTKNTKLIILCSPCNPSGVIYSTASLEAVVRVLQSPGFERVLVLVDEIYEQLVYDVEHKSLASFPGMRDRAITVNGFSKAFAMTGLRLGYATAPKNIAKAMCSLQSHMTTCPTSVVQWGGVAALEKTPPEWMPNVLKVLRVKRDLVMSELAKMDGVKSYTPEGAFYVLPDVSCCFAGRGGKSVEEGGVTNATEFATKLLDYGLSLVSGEAFGAPGTVRISFATSEEQLKQAMSRLGQLVKDLRAS